MKKILNKLAKIYNKAVHSTIFILIISVIIGFFVWLYIISIVNPSKTAEYTKVPVKIETVGSVPEYYGLSILSGTPSVTVTVNVEGSRSGLMRFNKDKINAYLDLTTVTSAGGYVLDIVVKSTDPEVVVVSYEPSSLFCEFDTSTTKVMDVRVEMSGQLDNGYVIKESSISPSTVEISGPTSVVSKITAVTMNVDMTGRTSDFSGTETLNFKNASNDNVNKSLLTVSSEVVNYDFNIVYCKTVVPKVNLVNALGGDESKYMNVEYDPTTIVLEGYETYLANMQDLVLGSISTDSILSNKALFNIAVPSSGSYVVSSLSSDMVTVTVSYDPTMVSTRTFVFSENEISNFIIENVPEGFTAEIDNQSVRLSVRGIKSVLDTLKNRDIVVKVDMSKKDEKGTYPVEFEFPSDLAYGLLNEVLVNITTTEIESEETGN